MFINNKKRERIVVGLMLIASLFLFPTYITILIAFLFSIYFYRYIEFPIIALLIDVLYKPINHTTIGLFGISFIILVIIEYFRDRVKIKGKDTL